MQLTGCFVIALKTVPIGTHRIPMSSFAQSPSEGTEGKGNGARAGIFVSNRRAYHPVKKIENIKIMIKKLARQMRQKHINIVT